VTVFGEVVTSMNLLPAAFFPARSAAVSSATVVCHWRAFSWVSDALAGPASGAPRAPAPYRR